MKIPVIEGCCSLKGASIRFCLLSHACVCSSKADTLEGKSLAKQAASREGVWSLGEGRGASVWHTLTF